MIDSSFSKSEILNIIVRYSILSLGTFLSTKWLLNQLHPTRSHSKIVKKKAKEKLKKIGFYAESNFSEYELIFASHLIDPSQIHVTWSSIAGLDETIEELKESIIFPIQQRDLIIESQLIQIPRGVLLQGPPGCGKTMIAKAMAREAEMRFINLDLSVLTDKWYGESQKLVSALFSFATKVQPCIIFIDEIDILLRNRNSRDHEVTAMIKGQFMTLWDGLITDPNCTVIVMGATNRPADIDQAILRRMPHKFTINIPKENQRRDILKLILKNERLSEDVNIQSLAKMTTGYSGSDLRELCRLAAINRVREYIKSDIKNTRKTDESNIHFGALRQISKCDLEMAVRRINCSKNLL